MEKKDNLFLLICSLSKSEKRYFKVFMARHKRNINTNNSILLFDAYEKLKVYDEKLFLESIKGKPVALNLKLNRFYLHKQLLKSLEQFYSAIDSETILQRMIRQIKILKQKDLYSQCFLLINKAKELAKKTDKHAYMAEVLKFELELWGVNKFVNVTADTISSLNKELIKQNKMNEEVSTYMVLHKSLLLLISQKGLVRSLKDKEEFSHLMSHKLLQKKITTHDSFWSKFYFHYCHALFHGTFIDFKRAYMHSCELMLLIEKHPDFKTDKTGYANTIISNHFTICESLKKYNEAQAQLTKLVKQSIEKNAPPAAYISALYLQARLLHKVGDFLNGEIVAQKIIHQLKPQFKKYIAPIHLTSIYFEISKIFFGLENFLKANYWLNKIFDEQLIYIGKSRHYGFKIYRLILYYEMQKEDLIEYELKSTYRLMHKQKRLYRFEEVLLFFIRDAIKNIRGKEQLAENFQKLRNDLLKISRDKFEANALVYFDFISWLESKIQNRRFADIVKEKSTGK